MLQIRTILHPTDFSDHSDAAFRLACSLARDYGAQLLLLHVGQLPIPPEGTVFPEPEHYREELLEELYSLQIQAPQLSVKTRLELASDPVTEILRVAQETESDLIVLGTHGREGLGRLLLGSVAEKTMRQAPCPVLTVRTPVALKQPAKERIPETAGAEPEALKP